MSELQRGNLTIGSWLSMGDPYIAEIMARSGFDWLVIDMEHSAANGPAEVQRLIQVIDLAGCKPLVRVPANDPVAIKLVLDAGAHGIIVPMINHPDEAEAAVQAARYPPEGKRGVGLWRAQEYGRGFEEYMKWFQKEGIILIQIEHREGVGNLDRILKVDGIDGYIIGPYDLSASLGMPGEFSHPQFKKMLTEIKRISMHTDKWVGIHIVHPDHDLLRERIEEGYNFIAYGVDFTFLTWAIDSEMGKIQGVLERVKGKQ